VARRLYGLLATAFDLAPEAEISIEMDPRVGSRDQVRLLGQLGFTRVSLGVQNLDCGVQSAIGRLQTEEETVSLFEACREAGFESINLDLVYGLPRQTASTFDRTVERVVDLGPDRVATFSYAHLPKLRPNQKAIDEGELPAPRVKLGLFLRALERFRDAGYDWVGIDHFARRDDELAVAARERRLQRNFMAARWRSG
jgi:oxygen-independent coproporphyrinogen-3 oxidase